MMPCHLGYFSNTGFLRKGFRQQFVQYKETKKKQKYNARFGAHQQALRLKLFTGKTTLPSMGRSQ